MYNEEGYIANVGAFAGIGLYNQPFNSVYLDGTIDPCITPYYNGTWLMNVVGYFNQTAVMNESLNEVENNKENLRAVTTDPCTLNSSPSCVSWGWGIGFVKSQLFLNEPHPVIPTTGLLMHWIDFYWPTTPYVTLVITLQSLSSLPQGFYHGLQICQSQNTFISIKSTPLIQNFTVKNIQTNNLYYITLFNDPNFPAPSNLTITISFYNQTSGVTDEVPWYGWLFISLGIFIVIIIVIIITIKFTGARSKTDPEKQPLSSS